MVNAAKQAIGTLFVVGLMGLLAGLVIASSARGGQVEERLGFPEEMKLGEQYQTSLFACHVAQKSAKILSANQAKKHGHLFVIARADRNYDGSVDMLMIFDAKPTSEPDTVTLESPFPHYYVYDTDFDGQPDKAYRDINGNGECKGMQEVPVKYILDDNMKQEAGSGEIS